MNQRDAEAFIRNLFLCARTRPPGAQVQFMMRPPTTREEAPFGTEYWLDDDAIYDLAADLLGRIANLQTEERLSEIAYRLGQFITYHYRSDWFIRQRQVDNLGQLLEDSYLTAIVPDFLQKFTVQNTRFVLATPIRNISVFEPIVSEQLVIASPNNLMAHPVVTEWVLRDFNPRIFPSSEFRSIRAQNVSDADMWIIVRGATQNSVRSLLYSCLGALWATLDARDCIFSGADPFVGEEIWERNGSHIFTSGDEFLRVPLDRVSLTSQRTDSLRRLLLREGGFVNLRKRRVACEFAYYLWSGEGTVSFSNAVIALDALFGGERSNTARISSAAAHVLADENQSERIAEIIRFRNSVLHGGVASVLQSSRYRRYVRRFKSEPDADTGSILRSCLRRSFEDHPNFVFEETKKTRIEIVKTFFRLMLNPEWRPD